MEPAEDNSLEDAIRWLVGTILGVLLMDKLDAWVRGVKLDDDVAELKFEVERAESLIDDVRGRAHGNKSLARSLARLKELLYDADDMVDELDYYRLQQQVEGVRSDQPEGMHVAEPVDGVTRDEAEGMHGAERVTEILTDHTDTPTRNRRVGKLRSKTWDHFTVQYIGKRPSTANCKYCGEQFNCDTKTNGLSTMTSHIKNICKKKPAGALPPIPLSIGDTSGSATATEVATSSSNRKRKRTEKEPAQTTAVITHTPWDKAELSNRIKTITSQLQGILEALSKLLERHGSSCASSLNHHQSAILDQNLRTSSLLPGKVYGRDAEKISIRNLILEDISGGVRVLPIVGIAGVGKTALAQFVYSDPEVETQFDQRIWVWVSRNFNEVRLTREMLDFVSQERHEGISSFAKLQEILRSHANSKRLLIIFDDVWDDMKDCRWNKLLAPFISGQGNRIVVLITTRNLSVAKRLGTLKPVKLNALENDDFWLLFKSRAFGDGTYEGPRNLSTIGRKIAEKLKGNPLAAVSTGALLREDLTVDHWSNILEKEYWKSLGLVEGIMPALKLSYDQLPYHLQQCFSYCSIFPNKHKFLAKDLVYMWISQGFVNTTCLTKRLEETGWEYLTDLVNLGFFQQVQQEKDFSPDNQICYPENGLMHDFARIVSRNYCATINGLQCTKILPTIQHLSVVTDSAYSIDRFGHIPRNNKFEEKLKSTVISVRKLRTLVLIGKYDSHFFQVFQDKFRTAHNLRLLQVSATSSDFNSLVCSLVDPTHLRYVKHKSDSLDRAPPLVLIKFFHLQVLDVGSDNDTGVPYGMNKLVSLRHLVAGNGVYSSIANIGSMRSLQELHDFKVQPLSGSFEISQLQSMNELVELWLSQLYNVESQVEAYGAGLRDKVHLTKLHLSWKDAFSDEEHNSDSSSESSEHLLLMDDGARSSEPSMNTAREVLEGLEPHMDLKHLQISGYDGTTSPIWLASNISVTSLQTLQLDDCRGWRILPSLKSLPFLTKLKLSSMREVSEVSVPSLEELILVQMPKLERCSCTSVEGMNSRLKALQIVRCKALKEFDLFEIDDKFEIDQRSWLPDLRKLILRGCPHLKVVKPLSPSTTISELLVRGVSLLPTMMGSSSGNLSIGLLEYESKYIDEYSDELRILDDKILAFCNLTNLKSMTIGGCRNLTSFSLEGFSHLVYLKNLELQMCEKLFSSDVIAEYIFEDVTAFPSLQILSIYSCGITGEWLCLLLKHAPVLEDLHLQNISGIQEGDSLPGEQDDALTLLAQDRLVQIPLNIISSLKKITIYFCPNLTFKWSEEGFSGCTSLQEVNISGCRHLLSSLVHYDGNDDPADGRLLLPASLEGLDISNTYSVERLQPCFPSDPTSLKRLVLWDSPDLESLQLRSCTALEILVIARCESLTALEGLESLGSLRHLEVSSCPGLGPCLESFFSMEGYELCSRLETFHVDEPSVFTTSSCVDLISLQRLKLRGLVLTEEQGRALVLLTSLQELEFYNCYNLVDLPAGLHLLPSLQQLQFISCPKLVHLPVELHAIPSLKRLKIVSCGGILRLPETGLPHSLEELEILICSKELTDQCRLLATSKLRVKIYGCY